MRGGHSGAGVGSSACCSGVSGWGASPKGGRRITITAPVMNGRSGAIMEVRFQCAEKFDHVVKVMYWASGNGKKKDLPGNLRKFSDAAEVDVQSCQMLIPRSAKKKHS